jgi:hypothetical protein
VSHDENLCTCPRWLARAGISDEFIRKIEARAKMRWLCTRCNRPLLPIDSERAAVLLGPVGTPRSREENPECTGDKPSTEDQPVVHLLHLTSERGNGMADQERSRADRIHQECPSCTCGAPTKRWTDWTGQLKEKVLEEGGRWTGKRAMEYLHSIGFACTIERARVCMKKIAEQEPSRVVVAEGHRWIWEVR